MSRIKTHSTTNSNVTQGENLIFDGSSSLVLRSGAATLSLTEDQISLTGSAVNVNAALKVNGRATVASSMSWGGGKPIDSSNRVVLARKDGVVELTSPVLKGNVSVIASSFEVKSPTVQVGALTTNSSSARLAIGKSFVSVTNEIELKSATTMHVSASDMGASLFLGDASDGNGGHAIISGGPSDGGSKGTVLITSDTDNAAQFDDNIAPGETRMLLWDVDSGSLQRVSVGPPDSAGPGYKALRITN